MKQQFYDRYGSLLMGMIRMASIDSSTGETTEPTTDEQKYTSAPCLTVQFLSSFVIIFKVIKKKKVKNS